MRNPQPAAGFRAVAASDPESAALASAIRELRARMRVSQEAVSLNAGLGINYVSRVESERIQPSFRAVARIARALDVPLAELVRVYEERLASRG